MGIIKILVIIAIAYGGYRHWQKQELAKADGSSGGQAVATLHGASANGFLPLPPAEGQSQFAVVIFAAKNCPQEDAQRADRLADDLTRSGVQVQRSDEIGFSNADPALFERVNAVMTGKLPIVFVRGSAKANPSLAEVIAEYRGTAKQ